MTTPEITTESTTCTFRIDYGGEATVMWSATDMFPDKYWITQDGTQIASGSWSSGDVIIHYQDLSSLYAGYVTLRVNDTSGNEAYSMVKVEVVTKDEGNGEPITEPTTTTQPAIGFSLIVGLFLLGILAANRIRKVGQSNDKKAR